MTDIKYGDPMHFFGKHRCYDKCVIEVHDYIMIQFTEGAPELYRVDDIVEDGAYLLKIKIEYNEDAGSFQVNTYSEIFIENEDLNQIESKISEPYFWNCMLNLLVINRII